MLDTKRTRLVVRPLDILAMIGLIIVSIVTTHVMISLMASAAHMVGSVLP